MELEFNLKEIQHLLLVAEIALEHSGDLSLREYIPENDLDKLYSKVIKYRKIMEKKLK